MKSHSQTTTRSAPASMRAIALLFALIPFATTDSRADEIPEKPPLSRYAPLWTNSPFTSRPAVVAPEPTPEVNPLDDYALIGVSPSSEGFRVTLINRNDPTERIVIDSGRPNPRHDFKVLEIDRQPGRPLATTVRMSKGNMVGTVGFESNLLTLTPPPAAAPQPRGNQPPGVNPGDAQAGQEDAPRRQPRPRVVPPPGGQQPQQPPTANPGRGQRATQGTNRQRPERRTNR